MKKILKRNGGNYKYEINYWFDSVETEQQAYILGLLYSDGWVSCNKIGIKLHIKDIELLKKVRDIFGLKIPISINKNNCSLEVCTKEGMNNLINLGCYPKKSYKNLKIPDINKNLINHFIRGYFDGDGTIFIDKTSNNRLKINICSISKTILEDIEQQFLINNIDCKINTEIREGKTFKTPQGFSSNCKNMHRLFVRKIDSIQKLFDYLYKDASIYLERKHNLFLKQVNTEVNL